MDSSSDDEPLSIKRARLLSRNYVSETGSPASKRSSQRQSRMLTSPIGPEKSNHSGSNQRSNDSPTQGGQWPAASVSGTIDYLLNRLSILEGDMTKTIETKVEKLLKEKLKTFDNVIERKVKQHLESDAVQQVINQCVKQSLSSARDDSHGSSVFSQKHREANPVQRYPSPKRSCDVNMGNTESAPVNPSVEYESDPGSLFYHSQGSSAFLQKHSRMHEEQGCQSPKGTCDTDTGNPSKGINLNRFPPENTRPPVAASQKRRRSSPAQGCPPPKRTLMTQASSAAGPDDSTITRPASRKTRQHSALRPNIHPFQKESLEGQHLSDSERRASMQDTSARDERRRSSTNVRTYGSIPSGPSADRCTRAPRGQRRHRDWRDPRYGRN